MSEIVLFDQVDKGKLNKVSQIISRMSSDELQEMATKKCIDYLTIDQPVELDVSSVTLDLLLGVENAVVVASISNYPECLIGHIEIAGLTLSMRHSNKEIDIPVICLFPSSSEKTLRHEKIHACQYLLDNAAPLSSGERELYYETSIQMGIQRLAASKGKDTATDYVINASCYAFWNELEANFHTMENALLFEVVKHSYGSAVPIIRFEAMHDFLSWTPEEKDKAELIFNTFVDRLEGEIPWLYDSNINSSDLSLRKMVSWAHNDIKIYLMFGPDDDLDELE